MKTLTAALVGLIRLYQRTLSRLLPGVCRFRPSCSEYAVEALRIHGAWRGSGLALRRLARCHPFHPGGDDPVPPAGNGKRVNDSRTDLTVADPTLSGQEPPAAACHPAAKDI